jgi:hypothetical protein
VVRVAQKVLEPKTLQLLVFWPERLHDCCCWSTGASDTVSHSASLILNTVLDINVQCYQIALFNTWACVLKVTSLNWREVTCTLNRWRRQHPAAFAMLLKLLRVMNNGIKFDLTW